ncbi:MAG: hypothetical protein CFE43_07775 [Burkholderiales bacterium PBB3]|nr:MAG: hypothetical protein CFE43_07775 [Burkholderiales bacterium PBB3]
MTPDAPMHQRRRPLTPPELDAIPWIHLLAPAERERAVDDLRIADASPGDYVCRMGRPVTYWFGVSPGWACQLRRRFMHGQLAGAPDAPTAGGRKRENMSLRGSSWPLS